MAASKSSTPTVGAEAHEDGSVALGATIDGVFVSFVTLDKARVAQLVENAHNKAEDSEPEPDTGEG